VHVLLPAGVAMAGAAVAVESGRSELAQKVVADLPRRRWRQFTAVASLITVVGRLHETVAIWRPVTWLNTTRAFRPLARQRSYSAVKSAVETAGVGQIGPSMLAPAPPLTTLAHVAVGETREVGGRGEV
jgi:hypothetical protein